MLVSHTSLFPSCQSRPASKAYQPPLATQACLHICCRPSTSPPLSAAPHPLILCNSSSSNCPLSKLLQGPMHCLIPVTFSDCATWRRHQQLQPASSLVLTYKRRSHAWVLHGPEGCAVVSLNIYTTEWCPPTPHIFATAQPLQPMKAPKAENIQPPHQPDAHPPQGRQTPKLLEVNPNCQHSDRCS